VRVRPITDRPDPAATSPAVLHPAPAPTTDNHRAETVFKNSRRHFIFTVSTRRFPPCAQAPSKLYLKYLKHGRMQTGKRQIRR
jgi:hypothetical protein